MNNTSFFYIYAPEMIHKLNNAEEHVVLYYHGPFNNQIISEMSQGLRHQLAYTKQMGWKVFSIFVELVQNIYFYAKEYNIYNQNEPVGIVFVEESESAFEITAANFASIEALERIREKCEHINRLDNTQLRSYKNELLMRAEEDPTYKGGNIGLVQIALLSQEKIDFQTKFQNNHTAFFSLTTTVKKQTTS